LRFLEKKCYNIRSKFQFIRIKASLVAYDGRELYKKSELKIIKYGYIKRLPRKASDSNWIT
jgi:hypothetical protein